MSTQKTNTIAHPYLIIKAAIIVAVLLCINKGYAQEHNNWLIAGNVVLNFDSSPAQVVCNDDINGNYYNIALSDSNGGIKIYGCSGDSYSTFTIYNSDKTKQVELTGLPSLGIRNIIGCRLTTGEYCIAFVKKALQSGIIHIYLFDQNGILKKQMITEDKRYSAFLTFVSKDNKMILLSHNGLNSTIESYIISSNGIDYDKDYNINPAGFAQITHLSFCIRQSLDSKKIIAEYNNQISILDYDKATGKLELSNCFNTQSFHPFAFTKNDKYIVFIENNKLVGYPLDESLNFDQSNFIVLYDLTQIPGIETDKVQWDIQLGLDGRLYADPQLQEYLLAIDGIEEGNIAFDVLRNTCLKTTRTTLYTRFPQIPRPATATTETITVCPSATKKYSVESPEPGYTYHWNVTGGTLSSSIGSEVSVIWDETEGEGTISVYAEQTESGCKSDITYLKVHRQKAPSAAFDNAQVCYGEPLKISLSGTAPYEIFYTLDGDEKSATTSESTYTLPNTPGKYTITKVKDKNCEWLPSTGNTSEISPQLHKLHIVKE